MLIFQRTSFLTIIAQKLIPICTRPITESASAPTRGPITRDSIQIDFFCGPYPSHPYPQPLFYLNIIPSLHLHTLLTKTHNPTLQLVHVAFFMGPMLIHRQVNKWDQPPTKNQILLYFLNRPMDVGRMNGQHRNSNGSD